MVCVPIGNDGGSTGNTSQDLDMGGMGPFTLETYNAIEESLLADIGFGFDENEMISQISKSSFL